jgi:hypothetical protein
MGELFARRTEFAGEDTAKALQGLLGNANESGQGLIATVVGLATLILGATGGFNALKIPLDRVRGWALEHGRPIMPAAAAVQVVKQVVVIQDGRVVTTCSKRDELDTL